MPSPSLAHTLFKIYKSSPSFTASALFKIKLIWLSDLRFVPYDTRSLMVPVAISISAPQYLLDVQSLPSLPSGVPISSDVQLRYQWQKVTRFNVQPSHPIFFFFLEWYPQLCWAAKRDLIQRGETCALESIALESKSFAQLSHACWYAAMRVGTQFSTFLHVQDLDSRQLLFARLRKIGFQLPSAATWRSFWRSIYRWSKYLIHQIFRIFRSHEIFVRAPHCSL